VFVLAGFLADHLQNFVLVIRVLHVDHLGSALEGDQCNLHGQLHPRIGFFVNLPKLGKGHAPAGFLIVRFGVGDLSRVSCIGRVQAFHDGEAEQPNQHGAVFDVAVALEIVVQVLSYRLHIERIRRPASEIRSKSVQPHDVRLGYAFRSRELAAQARTIENDMFRAQSDLDRGIIDRGEYLKIRGRAKRKMLQIEEQADKLKGTD